MSEIAILAGKVALVTGSSSGAGVAIALELARHGARVAVHCRSAMAEAEAVVRRITDGGGTAAAFKADLAHADAPAALVTEVEQALGPISVLVNNAGPFADAPFRTLKPSSWDQVMSVNLRAPYLLAQKVAPAMEPRAGAASSISAPHPASCVPIPCTDSRRLPCCT